MKHTPHGYWLEEAGPVDPAPMLEGERSADVLVLGGGFTGLWTAWHVKQLAPQASVAVLEAGRCGHGPSGRNGGFCDAMWASVATMCDRWGAPAALAVAEAADSSVGAVGEFCAQEGVDAWFRRGGYMRVSTTSAQDRVLERSLGAARELGVQDEVRRLDAGQVTERCASPLFRGGVLYPTTATIQPARLVLGLRERLLARGVEIFEGSPVRSLREGPEGVQARTPGGTVRAGAAAIAIGAAATAPRGPLRGRLTIASSHIVLTEPVPDVIEEIGWEGDEAITDCRALLDYFRKTPDGRIAFGWGGGRIAKGARLDRRAELDAAVVASTAEHLHAFFPDLVGRRLTHAWGGPIDASPTHLPMLVPLPGGRAFAAAGYTGNGVGPSHMVARSLASLVLDRRDEPSRLAFVDPSPPRVPPEPFHWIGGESIRWGIDAKEEAEAAGRRPGPISSALAKVPDLIGYHIGR